MSRDGAVATARAGAVDRWSHRSTAAGWALLAVIVALDVVTPRSAVLISLVSLGVLVASLGSSRRQTAVIAVVAVVAALALGAVDGIFGTLDHLIRLTVVVATVGFAVYANHQRVRRQEAHARLAHVAEIAQQVMLRPPPRTIAGLGLVARYASSSDESLVGGDFYETAFTPTGVRVIVGDVRGKGLDGVRLAATVLATFREVVWDHELIPLVREIDGRVSKEASDEDFVTALVVEFSVDGWLRVVSCGHHPPLRIGPGLVTPLEPSRPTPPLGLDPEPVVDRFPFDVGERLLLCTDGLLEARDTRGAFFPVLDHADALRLPDLQDAVDEVVVRVHDHVPGALRDDLAVYLAERLTMPT